VNNIHKKGGTMTGVLQQFDTLPRPFQIGAMVLGFIVFWPIGLAVLAYLIWSRRMGCASYGHSGRDYDWKEANHWRRDRWERQMGHLQERMAHLQEKMNHWTGSRRSSFSTTGNAAFDEYRDDMLRRLEDEAKEFQDFLTRLRKARDKQEFDQFMTEREKREATPQPLPPETPAAA
jgi:hypothetical protein